MSLPVGQALLALLLDPLEQHVLDLVGAHNDRAATSSSSPLPKQVLGCRDRLA
jgi:hypothetical protein